MEPEMQSKGIKRKKKSFLQKTKKYFKKGIHGKGIHINEESFEYFLHVLKIMNQDFESEEDKRIFVQNVFEQLIGNEVNYSCNQVVSRIIDNLLPLASDEVLEKFMNEFSKELRLVCVDPFASYVFQKIMNTVTERYLTHNSNRGEDSLDSTISAKYSNWLTRTFKYVLNNFEEFMFDNFANHIMRTTVLCLVGESKTSKDNNQVSKEKSLPNEFIEILENFVDQLIKWFKFKELPFQNLSSAFLQDLIQCLDNVGSKRKKIVTHKLLDECFAPGSEIDCEEDQLSVLPSSFDSDACVRLVETVLSVASAKIFTQIYARCFVNRLSVLAVHPTSNFAVQKLIRYCKEKSEFEAIFDELSQSFESILKNGRHGVIVQLCEACMRLKTKQSVFMQLWGQYLGCYETNESQILLTPLTIFMKRRKEYDSDKEYSVQLHGSLLVQHMLKFNKPIKVINSLFEMKKSHLTKVFCDPKGSHIADAFFASEFVGEKSREKFIKTLQSSYSSLATSKHGSRVFDIVWKFASIKNRTMIAMELLENEAKLSGNPFGRPIISNTSLGTFRRNREDWIKAQTTNDKAKKLFAGIIN